MHEMHHFTFVVRVRVRVRVSLVTLELKLKLKFVGLKKLLIIIIIIIIIHGIHLIVNWRNIIINIMIAVLINIEKSIILHIFSSHLIQIDLVTYIYSWRPLTLTLSLASISPGKYIFATLSESWKSLLYSWWVSKPSLSSFCPVVIIEFWIVIAFCFCNKKENFPIRIHGLCQFGIGSWNCNSE